MIGHGAIILPGVTVSTGAVVGAVVTYTVVVGVPAKPIRQRFPAELIETLLRSAWWHWDHVTIKARFDDLLEINRFVERPVQ